ncbi:unnamed protein product [Closterium sp. NIES-65]|nr:unnamed protein product [Closterium sp. NIES-65]
MAALSNHEGDPGWEGVTVEVPSDDVAMPDWHDDAIDLTWQNSQPVSPQGALSQDFSQLISQDIKPDIQPFATYPPAMPPPVPVPEPAAEPGAGRGQETRRFDAAAAGGEEEVSGPGGAEEGVERGGMAAAGVGANAGAGAEGGLHGRAQGPEGMDVLQQVCTTCDVQGWAESCGGGWAGEFLRAAQGPGADVAGVPVADVAREPASDMAQVEEVPAEEARWLATDSYGSFG